MLGRGDQSSSEGMYEVLGEALRRADTGITVGYAVGKLLAAHVCRWYHLINH